VPLTFSTAVSVLFGYATVPALVIGSLLASHTLLGLRVISRLGEIRLEPMIVTVGATLVSDTLSLLVFSICVSIFRAGFSARSVGVQLLEILILVHFILVGLSRLGAWLLKKVANDKNAYFLVMLAILAIAGVIAKAITLPGIVGAFLAGVAINTAVPHKLAQEKLEFFGNLLFIPVFFIVTRLLINPVQFITTVGANLPLTRSFWLFSSARSSSCTDSQRALFAYWSEAPFYTTNRSAHWQRLQHPILRPTSSQPWLAHCPRDCFANGSAR
jgi:Kef-type K+ transport system membrane component KefB